MQPVAPRVDTASIVVVAQPDDVYRAFSDAHALISWLPPSNMTGRVLEYDFREGGRYRIELTYADDAPAQVGKTSGRTDISTGRFVGLEPGKRIVQTVEFESSEASFAGEMTMTWLFESVPVGTRVTITAEHVPPGISSADHDAGLRGSLQNLEGFLAVEPHKGTPRRVHPASFSAVQSSSAEMTMKTTRATATKTGTLFRMECAIETTIMASAARIWALLTNADEFPRWNSTVTSIEGEIAEGQTLTLRVPAAKDRVFKPKVSQVQPERSMIWSDGMAPMFKGVRTFTLTPNDDGSTKFSMTEAFSGLMLPVIKGSLPDFGPVFETYAEDLKLAAERRGS